MSRVKQTTIEEADALYEKYGKALENEHQGRYLAISSKGETLIGATDLEVLQGAAAAFGPGNFIFKIGEPAVGKWR